METESMPCAPLDAADARRWFADAVVGLEYLHFQGVVHYDLKPDNILVASDGRAVISDFGVSRVQPNRSDMCVGSPGTPTYTAPEVWSANSYQGRLADVWSLGVTLHAMVFGCLPYSAESQTVKLDLRGQQAERFVLAAFEGVWSAFAFMALLGVSYGFSATLFGALWPEIYGLKHLGAVRSVIVAFMVFATAMGPGLTGFLIDLGVPYPAQIMAMGLYCIAAAVMLTLVSRRLAARTRSGLDLAASQG